MDLIGESIIKKVKHGRVYREQWKESDPPYPLRNTVQYLNDLKVSIIALIRCGEVSIWPMNY